MEHSVVGLDRFWSKVNKDGPVPENRPDLGPCWLWLAATNPDGYGVFTFKHKGFYVHRLVHESFIGPIPKPLEIDHLCRTRNCCNPAHVEAVTRQENTKRGLSGKIPNASHTTFACHHTGFCRNGHLLSEAGTVIDTGGYQRCRECYRAKNKRAKRKALAKTA